jgi:hypothetical protein
VEFAQSYECMIEKISIKKQKGELNDIAILFLNPKTDANLAKELFPNLPTLNSRSKKKADIYFPGYSDRSSEISTLIADGELINGKQWYFNQKQYLEFAERFSEIVGKEVYDPLIVLLIGEETAYLIKAISLEEIIDERYTLSNFLKEYIEATKLENSIDRAIDNILRKRKIIRFGKKLNSIVMNYGSIAFNVGGLILK